MSAYYVIGFNQESFSVRVDRKPKPITEAAERFARHVESLNADGQVHRIWTGSEAFNMGDGRIVTPKRAVFELFEIDLPLHSRVLTLCEYPGCVALACLAIKV